MVVAAVLAFVEVETARADFDQSRQWFESMGSARRTQLQQDLYWVGDYKGKADGKFGQETYAAITTYQQQRHLTPTGTLDAEDIASLSSAADRIRQIVRSHVSFSKKPSPPRVSKPKSVVYAPIKKPTTYKPSAYLRRPSVPPYARELAPRLSWVLILP
jgi:peptidoglycan hydrolase-like protein with peptidoglycan-binding domain